MLRGERHRPGLRRLWRGGPGCLLQPGWPKATRGSSFHPAQFDAHRSPLFVPASRRPFPIDRLFDKSRSYRVQMHVVQLFFELRLVVDFKRIIFPLPNRIISSHFGPIAKVRPLLPATDFVARPSFPAVHEPAQLARFRKPHHSMHMIGHPATTNHR